MARWSVGKSQATSLGATDSMPITQGGVDKYVIPQTIADLFKGTKGADIASAGTTSIGAATGMFVHVTGTTTITSFGTGTAGWLRLVRFAGALTLTHNATSLILPTGANITTAANDCAIFVSEGSSNWRCVGYLRANGMPLTADTDTTLAANSDTKVPTQKAVKAYVDGIVAAQDAMVFKGVIDCSTNPNYPAADRGWTYRVSVAGKIGGASGVNVQVGDILICLTDGTPSGDQATVGANWSIIQANIDGALTTDDIGVTVQAYNAGLSAISAFIETLMPAADAATARATLGAAASGDGAAAVAARNTVTAITSTAGAVAAIDYALGDYFTLALSENVTSWTGFSNLPGAGKGLTVMVRITQDATPRTVAWPASFKWAGGTPGAVSTGAGDVDVLALTSFDNGTTWRATLAKDFS